MDTPSPNITPTPPRSLFTRIFISPDERRLRAFWRLVGQFALLFVCLGIFGIPLGILYALSPAASSQALFFLGNIIQFLAVTVSIFLARKYFDRRTFVSLGLRWDAEAVRDLIVGMVITAFLMGLVYVIEWAAGWLTFDSFAWESQPFSQVLLGTLAIGLTYLLVGWAEEVIFRGYWLQNISAGLNVVWGVLISSVLFAISHLGNPNLNLLAVINLGLGGVFLAFAYVRTRRLWLPIGIHIGWNYFQGPVFGFPVSGTSPYILINQTVDGPETLTGGAFGPEAGLIIWLILALGAALVYWYTRQDERAISPTAQHDS